MTALPGNRYCRIVDSGGWPRIKQPSAVVITEKHWPQDTFNGPVTLVDVVDTSKCWKPVKYFVKFCTFTFFLFYLPKGVSLNEMELGLPSKEVIFEGSGSKSV